MMHEAYIIGAARGNISPLSIQSHAGQVRPILQELFEKYGAPARRVQALHWHGGEQDFWLSALDHPARAGESQEKTLGFSPEMARFQWPSVPLLAHATLHSAARAIESGDTDLVVLAQEAGNQAVALLLASPVPVGIYNLSPRVVIRQKLVLSSAPGGLLRSAYAAFQKTNHADAAEGLAEVSAQDSAEMVTADIGWLAAAKRLEVPADDAAAQAPFPGARWLEPGRDTPAGDLFLLQALADRLVDEKAQRGLLLSEGPHKSGLATVLERI